MTKPFVPNRDSPYLWVGNRYLIQDKKRYYKVYKVSTRQSATVQYYSFLIPYSIVNKEKIHNIVKRYGLDLPVMQEGFDDYGGRLDNLSYSVYYKNIRPNTEQVSIIENAMFIFFKDSFSVKTYFSEKGEKTLWDDKIK